MRTITVSSPAAATPITKEELKSFVRFTSTAEDTLIDMFIEAATNSVEEFLGLSLIDKEYTYTLDIFPRGNLIVLPFSPLTTLTSFQYKNSDGDYVDVDASLYGVDDTQLPSRIYLKDGKSWPDLSTDPSAVKIIYEAGEHETADTVPARIKTALDFLVGHYHQYRDTNDASSMPEFVRTLLFWDRIL